MKDTTFYWRGRTARSSNAPRELPDGRISQTNRQEFYRGWDDEDRLRRQPTGQQLEKSKATLSKLKDFAGSL